MKYEDQAILVMQLLEQAERLEEGVCLWKIRGTQNTEEEIRYLISEYVRQGCFEFRAILDNDRHFGVAISGLTEKGERLLRDLRERTDLNPRRYSGNKLLWSVIQVKEV